MSLLAPAVRVERPRLLRSTLTLAVAAMLAVLAPLSVRADPITFVGSPYATSSLGGDTTILYAPAAGSTIDLPSGAQFPYTKNASLTTAALATVTLENDSLGGVVLTLMDKFNVLTQTCSCYWIDAADLVKQVPGGLKGSGNYYLRMAGDGGAYNVKSGLFGIALAGQGAVTVGGPGIVGTASGAGSASSGATSATASPSASATVSAVSSTPAKSGSVPSASFSLLLVVSVVSVVLSMMTM
ncbi:hypothetical protein DFJ73DRAFT_861163 [Zopfochytrium polystomum]|nr:hypothetical protein DFJ73DRAFT_861163 [Zopfochytrium polystomum]